MYTVENTCLYCPPQQKTRGINSHLIGSEPWLSHELAPPDKDGCQQYTNMTGWISVPCMSEEELRQMPPGIEGGLYGVYGVSTTNSNHKHGEGYVYFDRFSGESDSLQGNNAWNIQLNPPTYFVGSYEYAVQFTDQQRPSSTNDVCVTSIDVTHQLYIPVCAAIDPPIQNLANGYATYVEGFITNTGRFQTNYCYNLSNPICVLAERSDLYGFNGHWAKSTGTILGWAYASSANFVSPTNQLAVAYTFPGDATASSFNLVMTDEENNLNPGPRSTGCNSSYCTTSFWSTN